MHKNEVIPIENHEGLFRDIESRAVINIDNAGYEAFMRQKSLLKKAKADAEANVNRILTLEQQVAELTASVRKILEESNGAPT